MDKLVPIVIDSREQTPWHFEEHQAIVRIDTLRTGDYAVAGDFGFAVERKSLSDFLGTISTGWARFCKEIARAKEAQFPNFPIVVEGTFSTCCFHDECGVLVPPQHDHNKLLPAFIVKRIAELTNMGCSVIFADNPEYASAIGFAILKERFEAINKD